ncbi:MAG TPA: hypothetical protein VM889_12655 [Candidatus Thermoplasmatota archaeon]|nr:hypothetical protein [Candidatus Thermoplasmatota archaeon]
MRIATDGYVGPDGLGGWAFVVDRPEGRLVESGALAGVASHLAEWIAIERALLWAEAEAPPGELALQTDSALVAKGLAARRPEISGEAGEIRARCRQALARLAARGVRVAVARVAREANAEADRAARAAARVTAGP